MPRDGSTTRECLIAAAERVFAEQGVEQAGLVGIHQQMVSEPTGVVVGSCGSAARPRIPACAPGPPG